MLRTKRAAPLTQSPALRGGGGELRLSDCVTKSHPWSLKYFMEPEVPGAEQLPLLQPGLPLQQGQQRTQPRAPLHPSPRHRQAGEGTGRAGSTLNQGAPGAGGGPPHPTPSPVCEQPMPSSSHKLNTPSQPLTQLWARIRVQTQDAEGLFEPTQRPQPQRPQPATPHCPLPPDALPTVPRPLLSKPSPYPKPSPPSPCSLLLSLHPSTRCSWDPSSHTAPHQPPLQSLSNRGPSPSLQLSGPGGLGNLKLEEAT